MSFAARSAGARPVEGDVLWKTGTPQDLENAPQPPPAFPTPPHRLDDDEHLSIYLIPEEKEPRQVAPASTLRRCTSVIVAAAQV